jgi:hypothetical protein
MGSLPQLVEALNAVDSLKEFETAIAGYENSEISDAIALADCLPQRQKLATFKDAQSGQAENSEHPSLCVYEPGEEVWFYSPHLEVKWNRGVVRAVGNGLVRVAKGAIGAWIDRCEKICPGDWQFQPE